MYMCKGKVLPLHIILHSLAHPTAGKLPTVLFEWEVELAPESFWELRRRINVLALTGIEFRLNQPAAMLLY